MGGAFRSCRASRPSRLSAGRAIMETVYSYWDFYCRFFSMQFNQMSPMKYGGLLIGIGVFGWFLMKNGSKR
jgi:hypothetical protein